MQQPEPGNSPFANEVDIRLLVEDDLAMVEQLVHSAGWNQRNLDWMRLLGYEPLGCFAAYSDSRLVGTVTSTTYGTELAWIGMMLVDPNFRRRGIATALMRRSMEYLRDKQATCIKLDATPEGQLVYERLGFTAEWKFHRWELAAELPANSIQPNQSMPFNYELDRAAFGVDRSTLLSKFDQASHTISTETGFGMLRSGRRASYLGPVVAWDSVGAERIIRGLLELNHGQVFWDIPGPNLAAQTMAEKLGFRPVRQLTRMAVGKMSTSPCMTLQFAIAGPETG